MRGEDGKLYTDWIWMDVTDQVNVVPYILSPPPASSSSSDSAAAPVNKYEHGRFRLFRQNKYGMVGSSLAVLGGAIEMSRNEPPLAAAQRELSEELSLSSRADSDWIDLGTYRVNVNRGHGYVSCFLLVDPLETRREEEEFHVDELERQATVDLTYTELEQAVRTHEFKEIKWQATASLALMEVRRLIEEEQRRIDSSEGGAETRQPVVEVAEDRSHQQRGRTRAASPQRTQVVQQAEAEDEQPMQTSE